MLPTSCKGNSLILARKRQFTDLNLKHTKGSNSFGYRSICPNFGQFVPVPICPRSICPNFFQNGYIFSSLKILKKCVCL